MKLPRTIIAASFALLLSGCSAAPLPRACLAGKPMVETQLYFGMNRKSGVISPRAWQRFVDHEIAPRLPEGFTVLGGRGFWRDAKTGRTVPENSRVVIRLHGENAAENKALAAIVEKYKQSFAQESVLRVDIPVCAAF